MKSIKPNLWSPSFMNEFKKWMAEHETRADEISIGKHVGTNLDLKHLIERIECVELEGNAVSLAKHFIKKGGMVHESTDEKVFIKTIKGSFYLPKSDVYETDL